MTYRAFGKEELRLVVRRVKPTPGSQLALFETYEYHAFVTDMVGSAVDLVPRQPTLACFGSTTEG
jgi:hypothetical protein